jgi:hypothetical protein
MGYKVKKDEDERHFLVEINGEDKSLGELSVEKLKALKMAGERLVENGEKSEGNVMRLLAQAELIYKGKKLRKVN